MGRELAKVDWEVTPAEMMVDQHQQALLGTIGKMQDVFILKRKKYSNGRMRPS